MARALAIILIVAGAIAVIGPGLDSNRQSSLWWLTAGIISMVIGAAVVTAFHRVKR